MPTQFPELFAQLAKRFTQNEEKTLTKGSATLRYVTARTVANRLDEVLGPENWWDEYAPLMADSVLCKLTIRLPDGSTLTKQDAGGAANMKDAGDDDKSMVSDAFKRAAARLGAGRYLYGDGVAPFVVDELARKKEERKAAKQQPEAPKADAPSTEARSEETASRSSINRQFQPATGQDGDDTPAHDPRSKEVTDLWGDRIGAHGLDVRTWDTLRSQLTAAFQERHNRHRVEQCGLIPAGPDNKHSMNEHRLQNYLVSEAVKAGADDPNTNPVDAKTGKRKPIGDGKKSAFIAQLYLDKHPQGWREWARDALRQYLDLRLEEARAAADAEAGYPPEGEAPLVGAVAGGDDPEVWKPGRE